MSNDKEHIAALERLLANLRQEYPEVYVRHTPAYREWERLTKDGPSDPPDR